MTTVETLSTYLGGDNTPAFYAYMNGNQTLAASTSTKFEMDVEYYDTDSAYDKDTNYRFTVPTGKGGKYQFSWATSIQSDADAEVSSRLHINGSYVDIRSLLTAAGTVNTSIATAATSSAVIVLAEDDYVELYGSQSGSSSEIANKNYCWFQGFRLIGV
jgi:hypothetical protein